MRMTSVIILWFRRTSNPVCLTHHELPHGFVSCNVTLDPKVGKRWHRKKEAWGHWQRNSGSAGPLTSARIGARGRKQETRFNKAGDGSGCMEAERRSSSGDWQHDDRHHDERYLSKSLHCDWNKNKEQIFRNYQGKCQNRWKWWQKNTWSWRKYGNVTRRDQMVWLTYRFVLTSWSEHKPLSYLEPHISWLSMEREQICSSRQRPYSEREGRYGVVCRILAI